MKNQTIDNDFSFITLSLERNLFSDLYHSVEFETLAKGRLGSQLVKLCKEGVPLLRSTTAYTTPAYQFSSLHEELLMAMNQHLKATQPLNFNHVLIEVYDSSYTKMKYHSDQALDLQSDGYIGIFSCYENPDALTTKRLRKLKIKEKSTSKEFEIVLSHHSLVLFSVQSNANYWHKIVLEGVHKHEQIPENRWLGMTFRTSKTFVNFRENIAYFSNGKTLSLATKEEKKAYLKLRAEENRSIKFSYPTIDYTLSQGDLIFPCELKDKNAKEGVGIQ